MEKCRFCLRSNELRSLLKEYTFRDTTEVYAKILTECFNITLSISKTSNDQICTLCVNRLRDAADFKSLALEAENKLLDPLSYVDADGLIQDRLKDEPESYEDIDVKKEVEFDGTIMDFNDYVDDDDVPNLHEEVNEGKIGPLPIRGGLSDDELSLINRFDVTKLRLPTVPQSFHRLVQKFTGKISAKDIQRMLNENQKKPLKRVGEKTALIHNFNILRKYSNITPFRTKTIFGIQCFYCREHKETIAELKNHCESHSEENSLPTSLWRYGQSSLSINIDVTDLKCNICQEKHKSLKDLKTHLSHNHHKMFYTNYPDKIIPYVMSESYYHCQICKFRFDTYMAVKIHMNKHYCHYICENCGAGFITQSRLTTHTRDVHAESKLTCPLCTKHFKSHIRLKCHIDSTHRNKKRFKCPYCDVRFSDYKIREQHMVKIHEIKVKMLDCKLCEKTFDSTTRLNRHIRRFHSLKKEFQCEICSYSAITNKELNMHMIKHNGPRIHECAVCKKKYARKKTLKEHMRIHLNDRRFACDACGLRFVQKHSLQCHVRSHHHQVLEWRPST